jgi:hypothetical protein
LCQKGYSAITNDATGFREFEGANLQNRVRGAECKVQLLGTENFSAAQEKTDLQKTAKVSWQN